MITRMKFLIAAIAVAGLASGSAFAGIVGSDHDFSGTGWAQGEICLPCHTPHGAQAGEQILWNHTMTTETFTMYSSFALDASMPTEPSHASKRCLSCHDGKVALDAFGGNAGSQFITGNELVGTDLSNDHPISFVYDSALATTDGGLFDPTTTNSGLGGTIDDDMLILGKVECGTCHDVHDSFNNPKLLKIANNGSALCLTCHDK